MNLRRAVILLAVVATLVSLPVVIGCGSSARGSSVFNTGGPPNLPTGTINMTVSDPSACSVPGGPYSHIFLTIQDIRVSPFTNAPANDSSFIDLTPGLRNNPKQIDLLAPGANCFLAKLINGKNVPAQAYGEMRVVLAATGNSVTLANGTSEPIQLGNESSDGILVPVSKLQNGAGMDVPAGVTTNFNLNIDGCASLVPSSGGFRLQAVASLNTVSPEGPNSITGTIIASTLSGSTITFGSPISGGRVVAALEQADGSRIDRVVIAAGADSAANVKFCPVPDGTYDVVVAAVDGAGVVYAPTLVHAVSVANGQALSIGNVPVASTGAGFATINGQINSQSPSGPDSEDVLLSAIMGSSTGGFTAPLVANASMREVVTTFPQSGCKGNNDCANYSLQVSGGFELEESGAGTTGTAFTIGTPAIYLIEGDALLIGQSNTPDCNPSTVVVQTLSSGVPAGGSVTLGPINFSNCH